MLAIASLVVALLSEANKVFTERRAEIKQNCIINIVTAANVLSTINVSTV